MQRDKGFWHSPIAYISQIRNLLQDSYLKGFPIVKELVQNADDAEASRMDIGWTRGVPLADHPLLEGPALFFINNGNFAREDARAIRQMGLSSKAEDPSIGKFGLGLKSIFHLCEAFFYLSSNEPSKQTFADRFPHTDILNPWSGDEDLLLHQDWDHFSESAQKSVKALLSPFTAGHRWFCLWLPLRRRSHCDGCDPIVNEFPGDSDSPPDSIFFPGLEIQLAQLLPMLRHLQNIRGWLPGSGDDQFREVFHVKAGDLFQRIQYTNQTPNKTWKLGGNVEIHLSGRGSMSVSFGGLEALFSNDSLERLKASEFWPRYNSIENGRVVSASEKAEPHCAVCFSRHPTNHKGKLSILWTVFIPVGQTERAIGCDGPYDYSVLLHGLFFLDPGRNHIEFGERTHQGDPTDERSLRLEWNRQLANQGTLRYLLPALNEFVSKNNLEPKNVLALTSALRESQLFNEHRNAICSRHQWAYCITASGGTWKLLRESEEVHEIPGPPVSEPHRPFEVLPKLQELMPETQVTFSDKPRLCRSPQVVSWPDRKLEQLLEIPVEEVFSSKGKLDYLVQFLGQGSASKSTIVSVANKLEELAREAFKEVEFGKLRQHKSLVQDFMGFLPSSRMMPLRGDSSPAFDPVLKGLLGLNLSVLLIPKDFEPENACEGSPGIQDLYNVFACLASPRAEWTAESDFDKVRTQIALQLVERSESERDTITGRCGTFKLFRGRNFSLEKDVALSLNELSSIDSQKTLFVPSYADDHRYHKALQKALSNAHVVLINKDIAKVLFGEGQVGICDSKACIRTIVNTRPRLASPDSRLELISQLQNLPTSEDSDEFVRALRYLLHGRIERLNDHLFLFVESETQTVWEKICRQALRIKGEEWRVVSHKLVDRIAGQHWGVLRITKTSSESVVALLREAGPENIDGELFSESERESLLAGIDQLSVLRKLHIHESLDGNLVSIEDDPNTYLEGDFQLSDALLDKVTIFRRSQRPVLAAKQEQLAASLDAKAAIEIVFKQEKPELYWLSIMDALEKIGNVGNLEEQFRQELKTTAWVPTADGRKVPPEDVVCIRGLEDDVARIVSVCGGAFTDVLSLSEGIRNHNAFLKVLTKGLFPSQAEAVEMLGEIMSEDQRFWVGEFSLDDFELIDFLERFREAFREASPETAPAYSTVDGICRKVPPQTCAEKLLPQLFRPMPEDRTVGVLNYLSESHEATKNSVFLQMFNWYLKAASRTFRVDHFLDKIRLLNRRQKWKPTRKLCVDADGVDGTYLLDYSHGRILQLQGSEGHGPIATEQGRQQYDTIGNGDEARFKRGASVLRDYFEEWEGSIQHEAIGGLLCLLGDYSGVKELAEAYLDKGNRTLENTRDLLEWIPISSPPGFEVVGAGEDIHTAMTKQRFFVNVIESDSVTLENLLGEPFLAPVERTFDHLLLGARSRPRKVYVPSYDYRIQELNLRKIRPEDHSTARLVKLLRNSANIVLERVYCQQIPNIEEFWEKLVRSEQLDISIAQDFLLEPAFFYVRQLGVHTHERIRAALKRWDCARRQKAEEAQIIESGRVVKSRSADRELRLAKEEFKNLILGDPQVQDQILKALRSKIGDHYQYTLKSIPFELFQNADDAVVELLGMLKENGQSLGSETRRFVIIWDHSQISFLHWGRPINQFRVGNFQEGRDLGYDRDLEKMLVMSSSDKLQEGAGPRVTGKFGLGFKSVFLITERPRVLSGKMGFEIIGGMLPHRLRISDELVHRLNRISPNNTRGTVFELPFGQEQYPAVVEMLDDFKTLTPVLLVFSKKLKHCEFHSEDGKKEVVSWAEDFVPKTKNVFLGLLQPAFGGYEPGTRGLVIRSMEGAILLSLGPRGFKHLPAEVPTIWVTAPTREHAGVGFAVNGGFDLDIGRAQLARDSSKNEGVARSVGREFGSSLCSLYDLSIRDWKEFLGALHLSEDTSSYEFWESLWELLGESMPSRSDERSGEALQLIRLMLWGDGHQGMLRLMSERPVLPSELWSAYRVLTQLNKVKFVAKGILCSESVFHEVSKWDEFRNRVHIGEVISRTKVADHFRRLYDELDWKEIDLCDVLLWGVGENRNIGPEKASHYGTLLNEQFLEEVQNGSEAQRREVKTLTELLRSLKFCGRDGMYHSSEKLLVANDSARQYRDESVRSRFAPDDRVLSHAYQEKALSFFRACQKQFLAPAKEMAEWALLADDEDKRFWVLRYLLEGELGRNLAWELRDRLRGRWLEDLENLPLLERFSDPQKDELLGVLWLRRWTPPPPPPLPEANVVLEAICNWWVDNKNELVARYEERTFPKGRPITPSPDFLESNTENRQEWLTLLLLGAVQTIGRTTPQQHREFLRQCGDEGWLEVFSDPAQNPADWIRVLQEYLDQEREDIRFYQWMKQFVSIFQLAKWLPHYAQCFLEINKMRDKFALTSILRPRSNPLFQGGGPDAPSMTRTLGIGANFVVRELVRNGVVDNHHAHPHCFVPAQRVRTLLTRIGYQNLIEHLGNRWATSKSMYEFLVHHLGSDRATFDLSFDLPLLAVSEDNDLQIRFLHETLPEEEDESFYEEEM